MKSSLLKLFQITKHYPIIVTILFAAVHFGIGHFLFGDKVTNIYDLFDEWYFSILIFYAIFICFIVNLTIKLNRALSLIKELESTNAAPDEIQNP
tara:strand:+ start:1935 stop:2219 length:285 start_codon:yes stop_codon:yes gene_type:complete